MATRSVEILNVMGAHGGLVSRTVEDNGVVRMKILMKRQDLEQVLEQVIKKRDNRQHDHVSVQGLQRPSASKPLEQRLKDMKRMRVLKSRHVSRDCRSYWRPILQSIPEASVLTV